MPEKKKNTKGGNGKKPQTKATGQGAKKKQSPAKKPTANSSKSRTKTTAARASAPKSKPAAKKQPVKATKPKAIKPNVPDTLKHSDIEEKDVQPIKINIQGKQPTQVPRRSAGKVQKIIIHYKID